MNRTSIILYTLCIVYFIVYLCYKYKKRAYIISTFNVGFFLYTFNIAISPIFFNSDTSWKGLGISAAVVMEKYMNESLIINCMGYLLYITFLFLFEFGNKEPKKVLRVSRIVENSISNQVIDIVYIVMIFFWHVICLVYCKGYPLFNGKRTFYLNTSISSIYLFFNMVILLFTFYYAIRYALNKKKIVFMIVGIVTIALQGNRAALITNLLLPIFIIFIYQKLLVRKQYDSEKKYETYNVGKKKKRSAIKKVVIVVPFLVVLGLWLQFVRKGNNGSVQQIIFELLYGNTFSDLRDGAFILKGFEENTNSEFLCGKTYLAALISFVPSSLSEFRYIWSWGRYTTTGLFGYINHFGLRGGNVMEAYINFKWIGVFMSAAIQGFIGAKLEKIFHSIFISEKVSIKGKEYFVFYILYLISGVFASSSSTYNIYVLIITIIGMILCTNMIKNIQK